MKPARKERGVLVAVGVLRDTLGAALAGPCAIPLLAYLGLRIAVVAVHFSWFHEPLASAFYPLLLKLYGEPATHFPNDVPAITAILTASNTAFDLFAGALAQGAFVVAYAGVFLGDRPSAGSVVRRAASRYPALLALAALGLAVLLGTGAAYRGLAHALGGAWPLGRVETEESSFLLATLLTIPLVYAPAFLLVRGLSLGASLRESLALFRAHPFASVFLVYPFLVVFLPEGWIFERSDAVVEAFSRTAMLVLFFVDAGLAALSLSLVTGCATRHVIYRRRLS